MAFQLKAFHAQEHEATMLHAAMLLLTGELLGAGKGEGGKLSLTIPAC